MINIQGTVQLQIEETDIDWSINASYIFNNKSDCLPPDHHRLGHIAQKL